MKAHVICCNDSVEFVVLYDEEKAKAKLEQLARNDFNRQPYGWTIGTSHIGTDAEWKAYRHRCYWHIHTVEVVQ